MGGVAAVGDSKISGEAVEEEEGAPLLVEIPIWNSSEAEGGTWELSAEISAETRPPITKVASEEEEAVALAEVLTATA